MIAREWDEKRDSTNSRLDYQEGGVKRKHNLEALWAGV
jgi:hypothetical protein